MAVAFDAGTGWVDASLTTNTHTHTPVGTPKGVVVLIAQYATSDDNVASVTYGGVTMSRVRTTPLGSGSTGFRTWLYFLGANIPAGAQSVVFTGSSFANSRDAWIATVTADGNTEVAASSGLANASMQNANFIVPTLAEFAGVLFAVLDSGISALGSIAVGAGRTTLGTRHDQGPATSMSQYAALTGADLIARWTHTTAASACASGLAVQEVSAASVDSPLAMLI